MDYPTFLFSHARNNNEPLLVDADCPERNLTWQHRSAHLGLQDGDCLALWATNSLYYYVLADAVVAAGGIFSGFSTLSNSSALTSVLGTAEIKWVFVDTNRLEETLKITSQYGIPDARVLAFNPADRPNQAESDHFAFSQLLKTEEDLYQDSWRYRGSPDKIGQETCFRTLTSGTTGFPKCAEIAHKTHIDRVSTKTPFSDLPNQRYLQVVGQYHTSGLYAHAWAIMGRHRYVVGREGDGASLIDQIYRNKINNALFLPRMVEKMHEAIKSGQRDVEMLEGMDLLTLAGSMVTPKTVESLRAIFPKCRVMAVIYGSTETGTISSTMIGPDFVAGHVGKPIPTIELRIMDIKTLKPLDKGKNGEVCVRGKTILGKYFNDDAATKSSLLPDEGGPWYRTGDIGHIDPATDNIVLTGRVREIFNVLDTEQQIYPAEIEGVLREYPGVKDAAITSIEARNGAHGLECAAYVVTKDQSTRAVDVLQFMAGSLESYKVPTGGIFFCASIPRNPMDKIEKHRLKTVMLEPRSVKHPTFKMH